VLIDRRSPLLFISINGESGAAFIICFWVLIFLSEHNLPESAYIGKICAIEGLEFSGKSHEKM